MPLQMLSTLSQNFNGGRSKRSAANLAKLQANAAATGSGWFTWGWCLLGGGWFGGNRKTCGMSTPTGSRILVDEGASET